MKRIIVTIVVCCLASVYPALGQYNNVDSLLKANNVPPLEDLIEAAVSHSPMSNYQVERGEEAKSLVKSSRREWFQYVGAESYYRYGRLGLIDYNSGNISPLPITSTQTQNWWYVGAFLRIPLSAFIDRQNQIRRAQSIQKQSEYLQQDARQQITIAVIEQYSNLLLNLDILQIKSILVETANAQMIDATNLYRDGKMDLERMAQLQELQAKSATEHATARAESRAALLRLETLTGITLRLKQ